MKTMICNTPCFKRSVVFALVIFCATGLFSCSDDKSSDDSGAKSIKLQKLDLSNTKYLSISREEGRAGSESEVGLFKIDSDGNMSTVVLTCTEEVDGTITKTLTNIRVVPMEIVSLCGTYTLMQNCYFYDEANNNIDMSQYYEPNVAFFHILVRNSDGKIFYIPEAAGNYFARANDFFLGQSTMDDRGNLYLFSEDGNLGMLSISNNELVIKQVNPNNVFIGYGEIMPVKNGTIIVKCDHEYTFLYPNGGYETTSLFDKGEIFLSNTSSGIKAVQVEERVEGNQRTECIAYFLTSSFASP